MLMALEIIATIGLGNGVIDVWGIPWEIVLW